MDGLLVMGRSSGTEASVSRTFVVVVVVVAGRVCHGPRSWSWSRSWTLCTQQGELHPCWQSYLSRNHGIRYLGSSSPITCRSRARARTRARANQRRWKEKEIQGRANRQRVRRGQRDIDS